MICCPIYALKFNIFSFLYSIKSEDPRMVWLKDQYLFLYYQDDLCMGPLAADAIKVCIFVSFLLSKYLHRKVI